MLTAMRFLSLFLLLTIGVRASDYHVIAHFPIGGEGGYDYIRFDEARLRLFVAHQQKIEVLDTETGKKIGEVSGFNGVHGIALAPEFNHGFATSGLDRSVVMFDLATLAPLKLIKYTGVKPDAIEYDAQTKRIYVANGSTTCDVTVIDPATGNITDTITLASKGKLEQIAFDGERMFVNDEDENVVHLIDLKRLVPVAQWKLSPGESPTGLAIDRAHHRLFSACGNNRLIVLDSETGRLVATVPIGSGPDGAVFDPSTGFIFCSNRDGTLTVIHEDTPDQFVVVQNAATVPGCRTLAFDRKSNRIFLPTARFGAPPAAKPEGTAVRAPLLKDTFEIVVVGR